MKYQVLVLLIIVLQSCSAYKGRKIDKAGYISRGNKIIELNPAATKQLEFTYFTCDGFYIKYGNEAILIDPFFSNPKLTGKIETNPAIVNKAMNEVVSSKDEIKAILVSHGHFDHLLDAPYLMQNYCTPSVKLYANKTACQISQRLGVDSVRTVNVQDGKSFIQLSDNIRMLPLRATHPPHLLGIKMLNGEYREKFKPTVKGFWRCGQPMAYLVDFMENGKIALRLLIQSSASNMPMQNIPDDVLAQRSIDIAIIPAALYSGVKGYPEAVLGKLNPKQVIICHWENFFKPYDTLSQTPYSVSLTNVIKFNERVEAVVGKGRYTLPLTGSKITVKY